MRFEVAQPAYLLLLLGMVPVIYFFMTSEAYIPRWRRYTSLVLRTAFVLALVLALADFRLVRRNDQLAVIFAIDVSDSVENDRMKTILEEVSDAAGEMTAKEIAGIVTFGSEAYIEAPPQPRPDFNNLASIPRSTGTDISRAIRLAVSSFPEGAEKRIILISDTNQTSGDAVKEATLARKNGVTIDGILIEGREQPEAILTAVRVPSMAEKDEPFEVRVHTESNYPAHAVLNIYRNDQRIHSQKVTIPVGEEVFSVIDRLGDENFYIYTATIEPEGDTNAQNNTGNGFVRVEGEPRVLYAEGMPGTASFLAQALEAEGIKTDVVTTGSFPEDIAELERYDAVILSDIPADSLYAGALDLQKMIKTYVHDLGGGLIMAGGHFSFGPGGYYKTDVEEALPVTMEVKKKRHYGQTAIVIVVDQSGSMMAMVPGGQTKMQLANEGAARTVELLFPSDKAGVIMCDTNPKWITRHMEEIRDKGHQAAITRKIRANRGGGGGIYVFSGLKEAYSYLSKTSASVKHIILFADTQDCEQQEGCEELVKKYYDSQKITLTSIGLGNKTDPHVPFLDTIRRAGHGRIETTADARKVPQLFTKETMLVAKQPIVEKPFKPQLAGYSQAIRGIDWSSSPDLKGYVITTPKDLAEIVLTTPFDNDLLMAQWQYGLGRSIAFTSDVKNNWALNWLGWPGYRKFWAQTVRYIMRNRNPAGYSISTGLDQGTGRITIDAVDDEGNFRNFLNLQARVVRPDGSSITIPVSQTGPGRYAGDFQADDKGSYVITLVERSSEGDIPIMTVGQTQPYSPEYRQMKSNPYLLERICSAGGGSILQDLSGIFEHSGNPGRSVQSIWEQLLIASLFLLFLDIAVRRLMITSDTFARMLFWRRGRRAAKSTATMTTLKRAKASAITRKFRLPEQPVGDAPTAKPVFTQKIDPAETQKKEEKKPPSKPEETSYTSRLREAKKRAKKQE